jgi:multidrug efflux pump
LLLWEGVVGQFMAILPKTFIVVLASSLFVALILTPPFIATYMKIDDINSKIDWKKSLKKAGIFAVVAVLFYLAKIYLLGNILNDNCPDVCIKLFGFSTACTLVSKQISGLARKYLYTPVASCPLRILAFGLFYRYRFSIDFFNGILFWKQSQSCILPRNRPADIYVTTELPIGTSIEKTDEVSVKVENIIDSIIGPVLPIVKSVTTTVGVGKGGMFENDASPNKSLISISFVEYKYRVELIHP